MRAGLSSRAVRRLSPKLELIEEIPSPHEYGVGIPLSSESSSNGSDSASAGAGDNGLEATEGVHQAKGKRKRPAPNRKTPPKSNNKRTKTVPVSVKSAAKPTEAIKDTAAVVVSNAVSLDLCKQTFVPLDRLIKSIFLLISSSKEIQQVIVK